MEYWLQKTPRRSFVPEETYLGIGVMDEDLNIQSIDHGFLQLFQRKGQMIIGKNFSEFGRFFFASWGQVEKRLRISMQENRIVDFSTVYIAASGEEKQIRMRFLPCHGKEERLICYVHKVEKADSWELLEGKRDFIFNSMAAGIVVVDMDGKISYINDVAIRMLGASNEEMIGRNYIDILSRYFSYTAKSLSFLGKALHEGISTTNSLDSIEKNGKTHYLQCDATILRNEAGDQAGAMLVMKDVTERILLEERVRSSEKLALIGELAAGAAHEIRNPLTSIKGFLQLLQRKEKLEEDEYLRISLEEVQKIESIISDLLLLANPVFTEFSSVHIIDVLKGALESLGHGLKLWDIRLHFRDNNFAPIWGDLQQLRIAFRNIIKNGLEAMPTGGHLTIEVEKYSLDMIKVSITDTGMGMSQEVRSRIFNPFFTLKDDKVGLGLAVTKRIIENHRGQVAVESREKRGTTFYVFLPVQEGY